MLFNSYIFIFCFFPLCMVGYFSFNHFGKYRISMGFLLAMSLWFYGYFMPSYIFVITGSIIGNYAIYRLMLGSKTAKTRKLWMIAGVVADCAVLLWFKYMDFFIGNINSVFKSGISLLHITLPLGISFFTFQQISFVVDAYRGETGKYDILSYACYVSYFPQLIAGPIVTHDELVPQFEDEKKKKFDFENFGRGLFLFALGLSKKVLLADTFGKAVDYGYGSYASLNSSGLFLLILFYTIQLYFDFSGYCDMAVGIGKMMNFDIPVNFNSPYKAVTITDFWDRWHMTLTRFFTKYIYIPLGGNRKGNVRTYINVLIVFFVSGFWHGAGWNFIFWGMCHGIMVVLTRMFKKQIIRIPKVITGFFTFVFVNLAWVFFRSDSMNTAWMVISGAFRFNFGQIDPSMIEAFRLPELVKLLSLTPLESKFPAILMILFIAIALYFMFFAKNSYERMKTMSPGAGSFIVTFVLLIWSVFSLSGVSTFLYFNF